MSTNRINALEKAPAEIWCKIFEKIEDRDLRTQAKISQVCKSFRDLNDGGGNNSGVRKEKIEHRWRYLNTTLAQELKAVSAESQEEYLFFFIFSKLPQIDRELNLYAFFNKASLDVNKKCVSFLPPTTPLMHIAKFPKLVKIGKFLLNNKDAEPNLQDTTLSTALHWAAFFGNHRLCRALVEKNANVNAQNNELKTPLHKAAVDCRLRGGAEAYNYLCSLPAVNQEITDQANKKAREYLPPLMPLSEDLLVKILIKVSGTDYLTQAKEIQLISKKFRVLFQERQNARWSRLWEDLKSYSGLNSPEDLFQFVLLLTLDHEKQRQHLIAILQKSAINPNFAYTVANGEISSRPLILVASHPHLLVVARLLLTKGASPNLSGYMNYTPLHQASSSNNIEMCKLLIAHGADINAQTTFGSTPLHEAARAASQLGDATVYYYLLTLPEINRDLVDQEGKKACDYYPSALAPVD